MIERQTDASILDTLCPMHFRFGKGGVISHVAPTLAKLRPSVVGVPFFDVFDVSRPDGLVRCTDLFAAAGRSLRLAFRDAPRTPFKGVLAVEGDEAVLDLSFAITDMDWLSTYTLSGSDFAPTDLTMEVLYLLEAKAAAMQVSRNLNGRLRSAKIAAEEQAYTDTLTGLRNRRALEHILSRIEDGPGPYAVMQMDLDKFKQVNDTLGHAAGDHVLQVAARRILAQIREADTAARIGGDEFVLLFAPCPERHVLEALASRLIMALEKPITFQGNEVGISTSIGITVSHSGHQETRDTVLSRADNALYAAKEAGRGRFVFQKISAEPAEDDAAQGAAG